MNYSEAKDFIFHESTAGSVYGLERVRTLADYMGLPSEGCKLIHVAGTNGKGSISRMLASCLSESGKRVGIFNSPFLNEPTEYLCADGQDASEEEYASVVEKVAKACNEIKEIIPEFMMPTEFELSFCAALEYFKEKECDYAVIECGLGGLTDATNIIPAPELAIITNIGLDHTALLGNSIEEIAEQKSGIIKKGCDVVAYPSTANAINVIEEKCRTEDCRLFIAEENPDEDINEEYINALSLKGEFQKKNLAVVLKAVEVLNSRKYSKCSEDESESDSESASVSENENNDIVQNEADIVKKDFISKDAVIEGLKNVEWPGRFEVIRENPYIVIDGGHNNQCIDALTESLDGIGFDGGILVIGVMKDKSYETMFKKLQKYVSYVITTEPANPRRLNAEESLKVWNELGVSGEAIRNPREAVKHAVELSSESLNVLIAGSLYMVGDIRKELLKENS